jgi:hypothetical protein
MSAKIRLAVVNSHGTGSKWVGVLLEVSATRLAPCLQPNKNMLSIPFQDNSMNIEHTSKHQTKMHITSARIRLTPMKPTI